MRQNRPKNLNLFTIRLPINALVSILHRISGMVLFLMLPLLLLSLQMLLTSTETYTSLIMVFSHWLCKFILMASAWAFFHHFFAGLRHLVMDMHYMRALGDARVSSRIVIGLTACALILFAWLIW